MPSLVRRVRREEVAWRKAGGARWRGEEGRRPARIERRGFVRDAEAPSEAVGHTAFGAPRRGLGMTVRVEDAAAGVDVESRAFADRVAVPAGLASVPVSACVLVPPTPGRARSSTRRRAGRTTTRRERVAVPTATRVSVVPVPPIRRRNLPVPPIRRRRVPVPPIRRPLLPLLPIRQSARRPRSPLVCRSSGSSSAGLHCSNGSARLGRGARALSSEMRWRRPVVGRRRGAFAGRRSRACAGRTGSTTARKGVAEVRWESSRGRNGKPSSFGRWLLVWRQVPQTLALRDHGRRRGLLRDDWFRLLCDGRWLVSVIVILAPRRTRSDVRLERRVEVLCIKWSEPSSSTCDRAGRGRRCEWLGRVSTSDRSGPAVVGGRGGGETRSCFGCDGRVRRRDPLHACRSDVLRLPANTSTRQFQPSSTSHEQQTLPGKLACLPPARKEVAEGEAPGALHPAAPSWTSRRSRSRPTCSPSVQSARRRVP